MQECPLDFPVLPTLFDPLVMDNSVLWSALKGCHSGKALVDDIRFPSHCLIRTDAILTFCNSLISSSFLNQAIAHFRQTESVWLV